MNINERGFSLIELMVTVSIIGTLAVMGVSDYRKMSIRAMYGSAKFTMTSIKTVAVGAVVAEEKYLFEITGCPCTLCEGNPVTSWRALGFQTPPRDPWGMPFQLDENDGEFGANDCRPDAIFTSGQNRGFVSSSSYTPNDDDMAVIIPYRFEHGCPNYPGLQYGPDYAY